MKRSLIIGLTAGLMLFAGCSSAPAEEVVAEVVLRTVETQTVGKESIANDFAYSGKAAAIKEISIVPTVPGKVTYFNYEVGDKVGNGATLFGVDSESLEDNLKSLELQLRTTLLSFENTKKNYENNKVLFEEGIISQNDMDQLQLAYDSAEASIESMELQIEILKKNIGDCVVTAPMGGVVTARNVEVGGFASQSAPAYTIMDLSKIKVEVGVSEQTVNQIKVGDEVSVKMTAISAEAFTGVVSTINPAASQAGTYNVSVEVPNGEGLIKSGMLAEVRFVTESAEEVIVLSHDTILTKDNDTYVFVLNGDIAKKTPVTTGIQTGEMIEITSGLEVGDIVVTRGQTYLEDGEQVKVSSSATVTTQTPEPEQQEEVEGE